MSKLTAEQKLEIAEFSKKQEQANTATIARILGYTSAQVRAVRHWDKKLGENYILSLKETIELSRKMELSIIEDYAKQVNTFKNNGAGKIKARQIMVDHIKNAKKYELKNGKILTLPSNTWAIEDLIYNQVSKRFRFVACEMKTKVFVHMVAKMNDYGKHNIPHLGKLGEIIDKADENEFDHIIADYCGALSSFKDEILKACANKIVKVGGTISVTILKARFEKEFATKINSFGNKLTSEDIELNNCENATKLFFKALTAITDFEIVEEFNYCDTSPMTLTVLKRVR